MIVGRFSDDDDSWSTIERLKKEKPLDRPVSKYPSFDRMQRSIKNDIDNWPRGHFKLKTRVLDVPHVPPEPPLSEEEKVVKLLKGGFEEKHGLTFDKFIEVYNKLLQDNPEKLI
jgi:hypothetical protein